MPPFCLAFKAQMTEGVRSFAVLDPLIAATRNCTEGLKPKRQKNCGKYTPASVHALHG